MNGIIDLWGYVYYKITPIKFYSGVLNGEMRQSLTEFIRRIK